MPHLRLSHRVIAERKDPYLLEGSGPRRHLVGDRFVASYLYGPLGMIARSQEFDNADPKDNRDLGRNGHPSVQSVGRWPPYAVQSVGDAHPTDVVSSLWVAHC